MMPAWVSSPSSSRSIASAHLHLSTCLRIDSRCDLALRTAFAPLILDQIHALEALATALQENFSLINLKIPEIALGASLASDSPFSMETPTTGIQQKVNFVLWANKQYQLVRTNSQAYNIMQIQNRHLTSFPEEVRPAVRALIGLLTS